MKVVIFAPNAGVSLSTGGGCKFTLQMAEVLLEAGHSVVLAGFHAVDLSNLASIHGIDLTRFGDRVSIARSAGGSDAYRVAVGLPARLSPYWAVLSPRFGRWVERTLTGLGPEAIIFQDDVPIAALPFLRDRPGLLYCHYPFRARRARRFPLGNSGRPLGERLADDVLDVALMRHLVPDPGDVLSRVWANSSLTAQAIRAVWPSARPEVLTTYVEPAGSGALAPGRKSAGTVMALGAVQRSKGYGALVAAAGRLGERTAVRSIRIVGNVRDPREFGRLRAAAGRIRGRTHVEFITDADRERVRELLAASGTIVQPARVEPFGAALLEGMAYSCAPVAFRGEASGAWVDILGRGEYGLGFESYDELASLLDSLAGDEALRDRQGRLGVDRAESFSKARFARGLMGSFH